MKVLSDPRGDALVTINPQHILSELAGLKRVSVALVSRLVARLVRLRFGWLSQIVDGR